MSKRKTDNTNQLSLFTQADFNDSLKSTIPKNIDSRTQVKVISFDKVIRENNVKLSREFRALSDDL